MATSGPPLALRVLHLPDRLVLHALSPPTPFDPSNRNALIDAANAAHRQHLPSPHLPSLLDLDLPPPPSPTSAAASRDRYLVIPFSSDAPFEVPTQELAGVPLRPSHPLPVEAAAGLLGIIHLPSGRYAVVATQVRRAGLLPSVRVYAVSRVKLIPLRAARSQRAEERELTVSVAKLLESGSVYFSYGADLTRAMDSRRRRAASAPNAFWWTWPMAERLGECAASWSMRTVYGHVGSHLMRFQCTGLERGAGEFLLTVVSRRSRRRAGTRYITRGVDAAGDVANFVETEQVVWVEERPEAYTSFVIIRGSVPVFWRQNNGIARPAPELDGSLAASRSAFQSHFADMTKSYGGVAAVSLVDKHGSESVLADAFERHFELDLRRYEGPLAPKLIAFDFHTHCGGKEYERGLAALLSSVKEDIGLYGIFATGLEATGKNSSQMGVFRVNCVDCLDRTNVVQSMISRVALATQLDAVFSLDLVGKVERQMMRLYGESEDKFKQIWGDNADAVSKQYSGTGALKTDFTRTGKRSTTGVIGDGVKSVMRMYYKNFVDEGRQEVIDILTGNAVIRPPLKLDSHLRDEVGNGGNSSGTEKPATSALWYSFEAMKINASGDKQTVFVELHDEAMFVTTGEGVSSEYPRHSLVAWSKFEDGRTTDRKNPVRLRLVYKASRKAPATTSPLDLQFKGGTPSRENFLRALVSWAKPEVASQLRGDNVRVRVLASLSAEQHSMRGWGLADGPRDNAYEVIALILPTASAATRSWGLAAVPCDVDDSNYVLVSACAATDRGPAIAVLVSRGAAATAMNVTEATSGSTAEFAAGGAAAVALNVMGTSFCFVSGMLSGPEDVFHALCSLKLGRPMFDVTNQFHHFTLAGLLGDMQWRREGSLAGGRDARRWQHLDDKSYCYSLANGLSIMRNSFPTLKYEDRLTVGGHPAEIGEYLDGEPGESRSMECVTLADGVVEGRPAPSLPKRASYCIASLIALRGEDIKTPPGVDANSQLSPFLRVHCEFSSADGVASHHASRPSSFPEWHEPIHVVMIPSDPNEIYNSFIVGQIAVPTPLSDPVSAGNFVIPLISAIDGAAQFCVPCRLAGIHTGNLLGTLKVEVGGRELLERGASLMNSSTSRNGRNTGRSLSSADRSSLPPAYAVSSSGRSKEGSLADSLQRRPKSGSSLKANSFTSSLPSSLRQKPSMDEVNVKLDAARKKGSKQIKSVVSRLSSMLNQPSSSFNSAAPEKFRNSRTEVVSTQNTSDVDSFYELADDAYDTSSTGTEVGSKSRVETEKSRGDVSDAPQLAALGLRPAKAGTAGSGSHSGAARHTLPERSLLDMSDDFSSFGRFQAAPSSASERSTGKNPSVIDDDPLLQGLRASAPAVLSSSSRSAVPVHAQTASVDLLLGGLSDEKSIIHRQRNVSTANDDGWTDFEGAGAFQK